MDSGLIRYLRHNEIAAGVVRAILSSDMQIFGILGDADTVATHAKHEYIFVPKASRESSGKHDLSRIRNDLAEMRFLEAVSGARYCLAAEKNGEEIRIDEDYRRRLLHELDCLNQG